MPDDIVKEAKERHAEAVEHERENTIEALEDLRMLAAGGRQWDEAIRRDREKNGRPCLEINRLPSFVSQVTGDIRLNPPAIKVRPAGEGADPKLAETLTGIIRNIESQSDADAAYITAAESAATCGQGFFRVTTEYSDDDGWDLDIRIRRILSPFAVLFDPAATDSVRSDAEYCFVETWTPKLSFQARYPKANCAGWDGEGDWTGWVRKDAIRLVEYWRKVPMSRRIMLLQSGATIDTTKLERDAIAQAVEAGGGMVRERTVQSHRVEMRLLNAIEELEDPTDWAGKYLPIIPVFGKEVHIGEEVVRSGVVRGARDPQRLFNIHRSALAEGVAMAPKAKWLGTPRHFAGYEPLWANANTNNSAYLLYNPDQAAPQGPQRIAPDMPGQGLLQEIGMAAQDMEATTGIYRDQLGKESNAQSGKAILARQREGDTGTFVYADNTARAVAHCGRILVDLIPKIYDTARTVRVLGEDGKEEFVPINQTVQDPITGKEVIINDISAGKYDVVASTGPSFSTRREEARQSMADFFSGVPMAAQVAGDLFAEAMDWPGSEGIAKRLRKTLPPGLADPEPGEPPPPPAPPGADVLLAQAEMAKAQAQMLKVQSEAKIAEAEMQLKVMELQLEAKRLELDRAELGVTAQDKQTNTRVKAMAAMANAQNARQNTQLKAVQVATDAAGRIASNRAQAHGMRVDSAHKHLDRLHDAHQADQQRRFQREQAAMAARMQMGDSRDDSE